MPVETFADGASVYSIASALLKGFVVDCDCGHSMYDENESGQKRYQKWVREFTGNVQKEFNELVKEKDSNAIPSRIDFIYNSPDNKRLARFTSMDVNKMTNEQGTAFLQGSDWL